MMKSLSKLDSTTSPLFLDASVLINFLVLNQAGEILRALGRPIFVEKMVCAEFDRYDAETKPLMDGFSKLLKDKRLSVIEMSASQLDTFFGLTSGVLTNNLGDGEAATITLAKDGGYAVTDEQKAIRVAKDVAPGVQVCSSLDLLCHERVIAACGMPAIATAVYAAIVVARMRIPKPWRAWVRDLIKEEKATNLPVDSAPPLAKVQK